MNIVFVSPHFDDAIGGCAGLAQRALANGRRARIVTVMSAPRAAPLVKHLVLPPGDWRPGEPLWYRAREDKRACDVIGCARGELGFTDALYRRSGGASRYKTPASLNGALHQADVNLHEEIANGATAFATEEEAAFAFPLAIGDHVDHQATAAAGALLAKRGAPVFFYREFFYQGAPKAMAHAIEGAARGALALSAEELDRKVKALACYTTQMANLYAGRDMEGDIRAREAVEHVFVPANDTHGLADKLGALGVQFAA